MGRVEDGMSMRFVVYELREMSDGEIESIPKWVFSNRDDACQWAWECAYECAAYDGPVGSNSGYDDGYEVQPHDDDGPYYVCDIYDVRHPYIAVWHADELERIFDHPLMA